ncbi:trichohyalin-like [Ornithodoros turicata]|uniref:trichohyalin-like n=1 Tax=Ornithodoros turicata TaxID=34597 RepID=UPI003139449B
MSGTCTGFLPLSAKPTRCKRCFRDISEHKKEPFTNSEKAKKNESQNIPRRASTAGQTSFQESQADKIAQLRRRRTVQDTIEDTSKVCSGHRRTLSSDGARHSMDLGSLKSDPEEQSSDKEQKESSTRRRRIKILDSQEVDKGVPVLPTDTAAVASPSADVEFILKVKTSANQHKLGDDSESVTLTETTDTTLSFHDSYEDLSDALSKMKTQLEAAEEKIKRLEQDKVELQKRKVTDSDKKALEKTASETLKMRSRINELETINEELKDDNKCLKLEVEELQAELERKESADIYKKETETLRLQLQQAENLCEELMEENEDVKKEKNSLEEQLDELQDQYREDQQSEFQDLKRELEATGKNCRVLQFKLRKAERRCEQLEIERGQLTDKVNDLQKTTKIEVDKTRMKVLEDEIKVANDLSVKLASELEVLKDAKAKLEIENSALKSAGNKGPSVKEPSKSKEAVVGKDYESICKDLYDSMEREADLREQLRFAEDENKSIRRKLNNIEQDNDTLVLQIRKLSGRHKSDDSESSDEDMSSEELRMQYDLQEQEMTVLRRKIEEREQQVEALEKEVKYLQEKLVSRPFTKVDLPEPPKNDADVDVFHKQKAKLLEYEARELRQKLIEKERENERLQTEIEVHRRKASKVIVRSRSLDSDLQVDLKRQLQLVEQEASILRQKSIDLENENEKLANENKRHLLRLSRKPPPGPQELLQLDNLELKEKLSDVEGRLNALKEEYERVAAGAAPSTVILQEYSPKKEKMSEGESDLIASLKKKIRAKEDETSGLQTKVVQMEIENNKLNRDYKKLKDALNFKKKPPRAVRETATRGELKDIIMDLEDEINELQITLRGREVAQETMAEELETAKKTLENFLLKNRHQENQVDEELETVKRQRDEYLSQLLQEREKVKALRKQLMSITKGTDVDILDKVTTLQQQQDNAETEIKTLQQKVLHEQTKVKELEERMSVMSNLNESLAASVKLLESKNEEQHEQLEQRKKALQNAETQLKLFKGKLESTESGYTVLKKECNQLKNELQEERMKAASPTGSSQGDIVWTKEREELRRKIDEMKGSLAVMIRKDDEKDKIFQDKENRLKQEHERKLEKSVKDVREFLQSEIKTLQGEQASLKAKLNEALELSQKKEKEAKTANEKARMLSNAHRREKEEWQNRLEDMEEKLRAEIRKRDRMEREHELELKTKSEDILQIQNRVVQLERENRRMATRLQEVEHEQLEERKQFEKDLAKEQEEYDDLTSRYELLEEEFVRMKNKLHIEKEQVEAGLKQLRKDHEKTTKEISTMRDNFTARQEAFVREKQDFQNLIRELEAKLTKLKDIEGERNRVRSNLNERDAIIAELKKSEQSFRDDKEKLRKRNEELMRRIAELERSERTLRALTMVKTDSQELKARLEHSGHVHKAEQAALRADYESRVNYMTSEAQALQSQITSIARERDQLRDKLEETLKNTSLRRERYRGKEALESIQTKAQQLQLQVDDLKNQLEESLTDNRKLLIQLEADRGSAEIQLSNLKSKLNQYEEKNILDASRGTAKAYAKTRLELAWEKERNDLQRVLGESQTTIKDLREKLIATENERDAEREALNRNIQELRKRLDQDDVCRDVIELQTELEEKKDAYERLKTQHDRLRRERDRLDRERESWKQRVATTMDVQALVGDITDDMKRLTDLVKLEGIFAEDQSKAQARPLRTGSTPKDDLMNILNKVAHQAEALKAACQPLREDDLIRRTTSFRRAISHSDMANQSPLIRAPPRTRSSIHRKTLSLGQGMSGADMKIWASGESLSGTPSGSQTSLRGRSTTTGYESDSSAVSEPPAHWRYGGFTSLSRDTDNESSNPGSLEEFPTQGKQKKTLKDRLKVLKRSSSDVRQDSTKEEKTLKSRLSKAFRSKEKIDAPEQRPRVTETQASKEQSDNLAAKSKKSLLGRLASKPPVSKTTDPRKTLDRKESFNETRV